MNVIWSALLHPARLRINQIYFNRRVILLSSRNQGQLTTNIKKMDTGAFSLLIRVGVLGAQKFLYYPQH